MKKAEETLINVGGILGNGGSPPIIVMGMLDNNARSPYKNSRPYEVRKNSKKVLNPVPNRDGITPKIQNSRPLTVRKKIKKC